MSTAHLLADAYAQSSGSSSVRTVVSLVIGSVAAWRGYVQAQRVERETGRRPWGWSPTGWSILCFCSVLIGLACLGSAERRIKKGLPATTTVAQAATWAPPAVPATSPAPVDGPAGYWTTAPATTDVRLARDILPGG